MDLEQGNVARDRGFTASTPHEKRLFHAKRRPAGDAARGKGGGCHQEGAVLATAVLCPPHDRPLGQGSDSAHAGAGRRAHRGHPRWGERAAGWLVGSEGGGTAGLRRRRNPQGRALEAQRRRREAYPTGEAEPTEVRKLDRAPETRHFLADESKGVIITANQGRNYEGESREEL